MTTERSAQLFATRNALFARQLDPAENRRRGQVEFFQQMDNIQQSLIDNDVIILDTGEELNPENPGHLQALLIYMESLQTRLSTIDGIAKADLKNQNALWKLQ